MPGECARIVAESGERDRDAHRCDERTRPMTGSGKKARKRDRSDTAGKPGKKHRAARKAKRASPASDAQTRSGKDHESRATGPAAVALGAASVIIAGIARLLRRRR
jgi:hypothetical protein